MDLFQKKLKYTDFGERQTVYDFINENVINSVDVLYGLTSDLPGISLTPDMFTRVISAVQLSALRSSLNVLFEDVTKQIELVKLGLSVIIPALQAYETSYGSFTWEELLSDTAHVERTTNNQTETNVDMITQETETITTHTERTTPATTTTLPVRQKNVTSIYPQENLSDSAPLPVDENGLPVTQYDYASGLSDTWQSGSQVTADGGNTTQTTDPTETNTLPQHSVVNQKTLDPDTTDETRDNKTFVYEMAQYRNELAAKWASLDIIKSYEHIYGSEVL